jgi:hypothetical protein
VRPVSDTAQKRSGAERFCAASLIVYLPSGPIAFAFSNSTPPGRPTALSKLVRSVQAAPTRPRGSRARNATCAGWTPHRRLARLLRRPARPQHLDDDQAAADADDLLAHAGAARRHRLVIDVEAGPDQRRVADADLPPDPCRLIQTSRQRLRGEVAA